VRGYGAAGKQEGLKFGIRHVFRQRPDNSAILRSAYHAGNGVSGARAACRDTPLADSLALQSKNLSVLGHFNDLPE